MSRTLSDYAKTPKRFTDKMEYLHDQCGWQAEEHTVIEIGKVLLELGRQFCDIPYSETGHAFREIVAMNVMYFMINNRYYTPKHGWEFEKLKVYPQLVSMYKAWNRGEHPSTTSPQYWYKRVQEQDIEGVNVSRELDRMRKAMRNGEHRELPRDGTYKPLIPPQSTIVHHSPQTTTTLALPPATVQARAIVAVIENSGDQANISLEPCFCFPSHLCIFQC